MRLGHQLLLLAAIGLTSTSAMAAGTPELPSDLPTLTLPDAVPDLDRLPDLPDLGALFPYPEIPDHPVPPELSVPLGPPGTLPPSDLPPGLKLGPPEGLPGGGPFAPVPEPSTAVLIGLGLLGLGARRRGRAGGGYGS